MNVFFFGGGILHRLNKMAPLAFGMAFGKNPNTFQSGSHCGGKLFNFQETKKIIDAGDFEVKIMNN